jgi:hypothetical protein
VRGLVFAPRHNTPGKHDADEFQREARAFAKLHEMISIDDVVLVDNSASLAKRTEYVLGCLEIRRSLDVVAFFCHGTRRALQLCAAGSVVRLGVCIADSGGDAVVVPLYACSAGGAPGTGAPGDGDGSFADLLRDAISDSFAAGVGRTTRVYAHTSAGHATRNPQVRLFASPAGPGGFDLVKRGTPAWSVWKRRLRDPKDTLRLRYPLLPVEDLHLELGRG